MVLTLLPCRLPQPPYRSLPRSITVAIYSVGWFYGFIHLSNTSVLGVEFTPATTDDRQVVPKMVAGLFGKLYGDKGYISKTLPLANPRHHKVRKNMKPEPLSDFDAILLKKTDAH